MSKNDTKRAPNFTSAEVNYLLNEVEKCKGIIECKKTDRTNVQEKLKAWQKIEAAFNSKFGQVFRNHVVLKTKYDNIKKTAKFRFAADKQEIYRTGGGVLPASTATAVDNKISQICQPEQMFGNEAVYDDDIIEEYDEFIEENIIDTKTEPVENTSWAKYTPQTLKTPIHSALSIKKEKTKDVWAKVAEAKLLKIDLEMEGLRKQSQLNELSETKLKLEIEKIGIEIEILRKGVHNI